MLRMAPIASDLSDPTSSQAPVNPPELSFLPEREAILLQEDAKIEFNKTLGGHYSNGKTGYDRVGALFLTWKDDDMQLRATEVDRLRHLFAKDFQFETQFFEIPSLRWESSLFKKLTEFIHEYDSPQCLAIIYYGGHGYPGMETHKFKLAAKANVGSDRDPAIFFDDFWTCLRWPICDQLLIIDCCYGARAFANAPTGKQKFEILSSAGENDIVPSPRQPGSFTKCFTDCLERLKRENVKGFCTSQLYRELYHMDELHGKPWLFDSAKQDHGKIWLRPQSVTPSTNGTEPNGNTRLSLTLRLHQSLDINTVLSQIALKMQYLPHVDEVRVESLYAPQERIEHMRGVLSQIQKLRPIIRRACAKRRLRKIQETLTGNDAKACKKNVIRFMYGEGSVHPALDWNPEVAGRINRQGAITKPLLPRKKSSTWPRLALTDTSGSSSNAVKRPRLEDT